MYKPLIFGAVGLGTLKLADIEILPVMSVTGGSREFEFETFLAVVG